MFNVCPTCGEYSVDKEIDIFGPFAVCPACRYAHPFIRQPLFIVTGPVTQGRLQSGLRSYLNCLSAWN